MLIVEKQSSNADGRQTTSAVPAGGIETG